MASCLQGFYEGFANANVVDRKWLQEKLDGKGVYQTWFLFRRTTVFGGSAGIEAFLQPDDVERASDDSSFDQFKPPWGGNDGPQNICPLWKGSDAAIPWYLNAPVPRIFTILDNKHHAARKAGYMRALTGENIGKVFWPAMVAAIEKHLPSWANNDNLSVVDAMGELVWDGVVHYIYGVPPPPSESAALRVATDKFLESLGSAPVFTANWKGARAATAMHLKLLRARLEALRAGQQEKQNVVPNSLLELLAFDTSPHRLSDEEIIYETFHSTFVSHGGFRCWVVNFLMELCNHPDEERLVAEEAVAAAGRCRTEFAFLRDACTRTTMGVHETKRLHNCLTKILFGRARRDFHALDVHVKKGERVLGAMEYTNRDRAVWGNDADQWRPDRMAHNGGASTYQGDLLSGSWKGPLKFAYCPHGAGDRLGPCTKRRCPGEELSTLMIKLIVLEVLSSYHLELVDGQDLNPRPIKLPVPKSGLQVRVRSRKQKKQ